MSVTQNRSNTIASGTGQTGSGYKCNGRAQSTVVAVNAKRGEHFHTGGAAAKASVTLVDIGSGPASDSDARNITLT